MFKYKLSKYKTNFIFYFVQGYRPIVMIKYNIKTHKNLTKLQ
jgi:hypothetical protein